MKKFKLTWVLLAILCISQFQHVDFVQAQEDIPNTLLLYDSIAYDSPYTGNIDDLKRLISSFKLDYVIMSSDKYQAGDLLPYKNVIMVQNKPDNTAINEYLEKDLLQFKGKYLHIGYNPPEVLLNELSININLTKATVINFSASNFNSNQFKLDNVNLIETYNTNTFTYGSISINSSQESYPLGVLNQNFAYLSFYLNEEVTSLYSSTLIHDWLEIEEQGNVYVLINEIYPYSDLEKLKSIAEKMFNAGIPFIVSVNPVFSNLDYPASKIYVETLKQIQYYNGSIVVDAPTVKNIFSAERTLIHQKMELFINWLMENGVAPLGTSAPLYWFFDDYFTQEGMSFYDSVIILPNKDITYYQPTNKTKNYKSSLYTVKYSDWKKSISSSEPLSSFPTNVAITMNYIDDFSNIESYITHLTQSWISIQDYKYSEHLVKTSQFIAESGKGNLTINGELLSKNNNSQAVDTNYVYKQKHTATFEKQFQFQNKVFIVIIVSVLIIFVFFLFNGYKLYKNKYVNKGM